MPRSLSDELRYRLFEYIESRPDASQRDIANHLGVSLGKANYCLKAIVEQGWVRTVRFNKSRNLSYVYILTEKGIEEKVATTRRFLQSRMTEYDALSVEIERLHDELRRMGQPDVATSKP